MPQARSIYLDLYQGKTRQNANFSLLLLGLRGIGSGKVVDMIMARLRLADMATSLMCSLQHLHTSLMCSLQHLHTSLMCSLHSYSRLCWNNQVILTHSPTCLRRPLKDAGSNLHKERLRLLRQSMSKPHIALRVEQNQASHVLTLKSELSQNSTSSAIRLLFYVKLKT